jgi:hypothetical protein
LWCWTASLKWAYVGRVLHWLHPLWHRTTTLNCSSLGLAASEARDGVQHGILARRWGKLSTTSSSEDSSRGGRGLKRLPCWRMSTVRRISWHESIDQLVGGWGLKQLTCWRDKAGG